MVVIQKGIKPQKQRPDASARLPKSLWRLWTDRRWLYWHISRVPILAKLRQHAPSVRRTSDFDPCGAAPKKINQLSASWISERTGKNPHSLGVIYRFFLKIHSQFSLIRSSSKFVFLTMIATAIALNSCVVVYFVICWIFFRYFWHSVGLWRVETRKRNVRLGPESASARGRLRCRWKGRPAARTPRWRPASPCRRPRRWCNGRRWFSVCPRCGTSDSSAASFCRRRWHPWWPEIGPAAPRRTLRRAR